MITGLVTLKASKPKNICNTCNRGMLHGTVLIILLMAPLLTVKEYQERLNKTNYKTTSRVCTVSPKKTCLFGRFMLVCVLLTQQKINKKGF